MLNFLKTSLIILMPNFVSLLVPALRKSLLEYVAKTENKIDDKLVEEISKALKK